MELNKNILCFKIQINLRVDHMDGHQLVIQETKDHTTALLEVMFVLGEQLLICTTKLAFMLESQFQEQMLRLCQGSGNSKLDHVSVLKKVIICIWLDIF